MRIPVNFIKGMDCHVAGGVYTAQQEHCPCIIFFDSTFISCVYFYGAIRTLHAVHAVVLPRCSTLFCFIGRLPNLVVRGMLNCFLVYVMYNQGGRSWHLAVFFLFRTPQPVSGGVSLTTILRHFLIFCSLQPCKWWIWSFQRSNLLSLRCCVVSFGQLPNRGAIEEESTQVPLPNSTHRCNLEWNRCDWEHLFTRFSDIA